MASHLNLRIKTRHAIAERPAQKTTTPIHPFQTHTIVLPTEPPLR